MSREKLPIAASVLLVTACATTAPQIEQPKDDTHNSAMHLIENRDNRFSSTRDSEALAAHRIPFIVAREYPQRFENVSDIISLMQARVAAEVAKDYPEYFSANDIIRAVETGLSSLECKTTYADIPMIWILTLRTPLMLKIMSQYNVTPQQIYALREFSLRFGKEDMAYLASKGITSEIIKKYRTQATVADILRGERKY